MYVGCLSAVKLVLGGRVEKYRIHEIRHRPILLWRAKMSIHPFHTYGFGA